MDTTTNTDGRRFDLPNSGVFMPDLSKHPILRQIHELIGAIEVCGASPELTRAVCMAASRLNGRFARAAPMWLRVSQKSTLTHWLPTW